MTISFICSVFVLCTLVTHNSCQKKTLDEAATATTIITTTRIDTTENLNTEGVMNIPRIALTDKQSFVEAEAKMKDLREHNIDHENWVENKSVEKASFKIAHDRENIYLEYRVKEKEIRAVEKGNHSAVWEDSCVEFFISFNGDYYYNLELSCIGEALLGYRLNRKDSKKASDEIIDAIKRKSSLGNENFALTRGDFEWTILAIIPVSSFWETDIKSLDGVTAKANFYKCGDKLTTPHYLSWAPVGTEKPNFHSPKYFKEIHFTK